MPSAVKHATYENQGSCLYNFGIKIIIISTSTIIKIDKICMKSVNRSCKLKVKVEPEHMNHSSKIMY